MFLWWWARIHGRVEGCIAFRDLLQIYYIRYVGSETTSRYLFIQCWLTLCIVCIDMRRIHLYYCCRINVYMVNAIYLWMHMHMHIRCSANKDIVCNCASSLQRTKHSQCAYCVYSVYIVSVFCILTYMDHGIFLWDIMRFRRWCVFLAIRSFLNQPFTR